MKLIDRTPYLSKNGEISFINQILATLKYGSAWYPEIKAQQIVVDILNRNLSKGYTLLRNITLPGSNVNIPLILVGPADVQVIVVTHIKGTYQAKDDTWGEFEGEKIRTPRSNLLVLTSRMARAVQYYLTKQGLKLSSVDGVLIASDPGMHIESVRPIIRVVMSDAIEHFVASINQASSTISASTAQTIITLLTEPQSIQSSAPAKAQPPIYGEQKAQPGESSAPAPELSEVLPWSGENLGFEFKEDSTQDLEKPFSSGPESHIESSPSQQLRQPDSKPFLFDKKQWILLAAFGVVEIIILLVFFWLIISNS
jgi:hypothetical protein